MENEMTLVERIERARSLDKERLAKQKDVDQLASEVAAHKAIILDAMMGMGAQQLSAPSKAWAKLGEKEVLHVRNWSKLYAFIVGCYELEADHEQDVAMMMLQRRPSDSVVKTFMEMHAMTPDDIGVEFETIDLVKLGG